MLCLCKRGFSIYAHRENAGFLAVKMIVVVIGIVRGKNASMNDGCDERLSR